MADSAKAQKLASARKKFKELKKEKQKSSTSKQDPNTLNGQDLVDITNENTTQLPNYFSNNNIEDAISFFDDLSQSTTVSDKLDVRKNSVNFLEYDTISNNPETTSIPENAPSESGTEMPKTCSNVESLQQLSSFVADLIEPGMEFGCESQLFPALNGSFESNLEKRNQDLASLLANEQLKTEKLSSSLLEYQTKISELESELKSKILDTKTNQELTRLRDELQCHIQTIAILVAEKTELSANLQQFQLAAREKTEECDDLQGRLKASRSRVADLEREINNNKSELLKNRENVDNFQKFQLDYGKLIREKEELMQDVLESREKSKKIAESNSELQLRVEELTGQLSMAQIKIQQLTAGELNQIDGKLEGLQQEKFNLEKQLSEFSENFKQIQKERDESNLQYQQYTQQLNSQLVNLASKLKELQEENSNLKLQEQNRISHISKMEKQLQNLQTTQINYATQKSGGDTKRQLDESMELLNNLKLEKLELEENYASVANENKLLQNELELKNTSMCELENVIEQLKTNQIDNVKLLAIMESDKVAASRAMAQNQDLKQQLEGMQEVFLKLNNDKVELTEKLLVEQNSSKELLGKLESTEVHLQTLADAIEIKDRELLSLRENHLHDEQLRDRLRHYEGLDNSSHSLQNELQEARAEIEKLNEEMSHSKHERNDMNGVEKESEGSRDELADKEWAMKHLEEKFLKTMDDIANLTEEKQRLEHLVLQLQSETETIGEYVALYQYQRSLLKQKSVEKDQQLTQLANDREVIKSKLEKLKELVQKLVVENGVIANELIQNEVLSEDSKGLCEEHARIHSEINRITVNQMGDSKDEHRGNGVEIAGQIIELLSEIKASNLVEPNENFHHCPWCSGQLITV